MNTLNGLSLHALPIHVMLVLMPLPALVLILTIFWVAARRRLTRAARLGGVVHRAVGLTDRERGGVDGTSPPPEQAAPPARRPRRYG